MTLPRAGDLNRRILIRRWEDVPAGDADLEAVFSEDWLCWAKIVPVGSLIYQGSIQTGETVTHRITVRCVPGKTDPASLSRQRVIVHGRQRWLVRRATDLEGAGLFTQIEAELTGGELDGLV